MPNRIETDHRTQHDEAHPSRAHLEAIGIPIWVRRSVAHPPALTSTREPPVLSDTPVIASPETPIAQSPRAQQSPTAQSSAAQSIAALDALDAEVRACCKCVLHQTRTHTVFGVGNPGAACMFIGEAPGAEEDRRGEPFVGRAGKLLDAMLAAIGLARDDVYIANIVKCRPPHNRDPRADEVMACSGYLKHQIDTISPRLLVAIGRVAAHSLLSTTVPIGRLRGRVHLYQAGGLPMLVMYHPAYLLRSPLEKRKAWDDLRQLHALLTEHSAPTP